MPRHAGLRLTSHYRFASSIGWNSSQTYATGQRVEFNGHLWEASTATVPGQSPVGIGDGSMADRDFLMTQRSGFAQTVTGGYAGATYVVTRTDDAGTASAPTVGTLRYGLTRHAPLWIVFDPALGTNITCVMNHSVGHVNCYADKTVDGRGRNVVIQGDASLTIGGYISSLDVGNDWTGGRGNHIWAYVTRQIFPMSSDHDSADCWSFSGASGEGPQGTYLPHGPTGYDLIWLFHCTGGQTGDGITDMTDAGPNGSRVTLDWCKFGASPDVDGWTWANNHTFGGAPQAPPAQLGQDNMPDNGKAALLGLEPTANIYGDAPYPDSAMVSISHCWYYATTDRNPQSRRTRIHMYNSLVSKWGMAPGIIQTLSPIFDNDSNHPGWPQPIVHSGFGQASIEIGNDSEILCQNTIFEPYQAGEVHVIQPLSGSTWNVTIPDVRAAVLVPTAPSPDCYLLMVNCLGLNGATNLSLSRNASHLFRTYSFADAAAPYGAVAERSNAGAPTFSDVGWSADWGGDAPYNYTLKTADNALHTQLQGACGNVQPWTLVS